MSDFESSSCFMLYFYVRKVQWCGKSKDKEETSNKTMEEKGKSWVKFWPF